MQINADLKGIDMQMGSMITPDRERMNEIIKQHLKERQEFIDEAKRGFAF